MTATASLTTSPTTGHRSLATRTLTVMVRAYQLVLSPWVTQQCRYYPCCSSYALSAIQVHGAVRGTWLAVRRLARCHPWTPGGVDYVPGSPEAIDFARREALAVHEGGTVPCSTPS